jgi:hypothetical protein
MEGRRSGACVGTRGLSVASEDGSKLRRGAAGEVALQQAPVVFLTLGTSATTATLSLDHLGGDEPLHEAIAVRLLDSPGGGGSRIGAGGALRRRASEQPDHLRHWHAVDRIDRRGGYSGRLLKITLVFLNLMLRLAFGQPQASALEPLLLPC